MKFNRLNEGFASYIQYLGMNFTHPDWEDVNKFPLFLMLEKNFLNNRNNYLASILFR